MIATLLAVMVYRRKNARAPRATGQIEARAKNVNYYDFTKRIALITNTS
jgi:hypothetical protein